MNKTAPHGMDLRDRVIWIIHDYVGSWKKYPYLEELTGIKARRWQNVCHHTQQPTLDMLTSLAEARPSLVAWMLTGRSLTQGQVNPENEGWQELIPDIKRPHFNSSETTPSANTEAPQVDKRIALEREATRTVESVLAKVDYDVSDELKAKIIAYLVEHQTFDEDKVAEVLSFNS